MQQLIAGIQRYIRDYYVKAGRIDIPNFWNVNFGKINQVLSCEEMC
jgi:hypothetical protein